MKHLLRAALGVLLLANLATAVQGSPQKPIASPAVQESPTGPDGPVENGEGLAPNVEEFRIPVGGCSAMAYCPTGGYVRCVSWSANGCVTRQDGTPPWVACDGEVYSCPAPPIP